MSVQRVCHVCIDLYMHVRVHACMRAYMHVICAYMYATYVYMNGCMTGCMHACVYTIKRVKCDVMLCNVMRAYAIAKH